MYKFFLALSLLSASLSTGALAQQRSGTAEEQAACSRDVQRHCRKVIDQGDFTILACLKDNRPKLTKACDQVLRNHGQ
jgi:Cysteine rich repeat